jgi:glycosyltransferase involved in cell wall biosynthesis
MRKAAFGLDADLYIAHLEQGIAVGLDLLRAGRRVAVDMEDWYSEDLPPTARRTRPLKLLRHFERELLTRAAYATCPSVAMSEVLAATYDCAPPRVIYNAFPWADRDALGTELKDRRDRTVPSIYWFSQTIGTDRGLDDLFSALPHLKQKLEIHLRGHVSPPMRDWLSSRIPEDWRESVFVHDLEDNDRLLSRISEHDIGFAGEMTLCRSREVTVTNKILHYLLGGLAVVASDTEGQREIARAAGDAVFLYQPGDPAGLADQINFLLGSPDQPAQAKAAALRTAKENFCWERQEPELLAAVKAALVRPH